MSDSNTFAFGKFIPGFDFLQKLAGQGGASGVPTAMGLHGWVAPTVSVEELDKRIQELKAVQFWLEQNVTALKATVQALEVQKMTLATLQGMNLSLVEVAKAFAPSPAAAPAAPTPAAAPAEGSQWPFAQAMPSGAASHQTSAQARDADQPRPDQADEAHEPTPAEPAAAPPPARSRAKAAKPAAAAPADASAAGMADPMQWWGALTDQFRHIAASALQQAGQMQAAATGLSQPAGRKASPASSRSAGSKSAAASAKTKPAPRSRKPAAKKAPAQRKTAAKAKPRTRRAG